VDEPSFILFEAKSHRRSFSVSPISRSHSFDFQVGPNRVHDVSLADDVIFRELSVNPLFSFFTRSSLALSLAPLRTLFVFIRQFPLIRSEGRFPGSCPLSSTSDVAALEALESADKLVSSCTYRISDIKFVRGSESNRSSGSVNEHRKNS